MLAAEPSTTLIAAPRPRLQRLPRVPATATLGWVVLLVGLMALVPAVDRQVTVAFGRLPLANSVVDVARAIVELTLTLTLVLAAVPLQGLFHARRRRLSTALLLPAAGFVAAGGVLTAGGVAFLRMAMGRARPEAVLTAGMWQLPYGDWFETGRLSGWRGVSLSSFPSVPAAVATLAVAAIVALASPRARKKGRLSLVLPAVAGLALGAALIGARQAWLGDVIGAVAMTSLLLHVLHAHVLNVPAQTAYVRRHRQYPATPVLAEARIAAWFALAAACLLGTTAIYSRIYLEPAPAVMVAALACAGAVAATRCGLALRRRFLQAFNDLPPPR